MDMRTAIIRIFEWLCLFGVYLATTIGVVVGGLAGGLLFAVIGGVGAFLVSAFVTGGALTLLDIGDSLPGWSKSRRSETPNLHRGNSCSLNVSAPVYCCCNQGFRTSSGSLAIFATIRRASNAITALLRTGELAAAPRFLRCRPIPPRNNVGDKLFLDHGVGRQRVWESLT